jgi:hypothetical protein
VSALSRRCRILLAGLAVLSMPSAMLTGTVLAAPAHASSAPAARAPLAARAATARAATARVIGATTVRSLPAGQQRDCSGQAVAGQAQCLTIRETAKAAASVPGITPTALRSAYGLGKAAATGGRGETVAVVMAYADPTAAQDLAVYRKHFSLPACTTAKGCLRIVNEHGKASSLPAGSASWAQTAALELEVTSALCPECKLVLVEANSNALADLGTAEDTAVARGARFVLDGWAEQEFTGQDAYDRYFNHPGVAVVAAAGNNGYEQTYPADLPYVTSVGGTTLIHTSLNTRGWAETAWSDTSSGCSTLEIKPSWQRSDTNPVTGCPNRTQNDVSADADPKSGAAVYDSYQESSKWVAEGGTALAAAIVTAAYALAGPPAARSYPASYPYQHARDLNDVTSGSNGGCVFQPAYLCTAGKGFDGPTGLGTPDGTGAFTAAGTDPVTLMDPGSQDAAAGSQIEFHITGLDSRGGAVLRYTAAGLPRGLTIAAVAHSTDAVVRGNLPPAEHSYTVTVTGTGTRKAGTTRFLIVAAGSLTPPTPATGEITTDIQASTGAGNDCLDGGTQTVGAAVTAPLCNETLEQIWTYLPEGGPGAPAELTTDGLCLGLSGTALVLVHCDQSAGSDGWYRLNDNLLANAATGNCLDAGDYSGPLTMQSCSGTLAHQQWLVQGSRLDSAIPGICIGADIPTQISPEQSVEVEPCGQSSLNYGFSFEPNNTISMGFGCISSGSGALVDATCTLPSSEGHWYVLSAGQLVDEGTGLCIDDVGDSTAVGTQLNMEPCYGGLGELWFVG